MCGVLTGVRNTSSWVRYRAIDYVQASNHLLLPDRVAEIRGNCGNLWMISSGASDVPRATCYWEGVKYHLQV